MKMCTEMLKGTMQGSVPKQTQQPLSSKRMLVHVQSKVRKYYQKNTVRIAPLKL